MIFHLCCADYVKFSLTCSTLKYYNMDFSDNMVFNKSVLPYLSNILLCSSPAVHTCKVQHPEFPSSAVKS